MGWWFGRKAAPADSRPFVPAWLGTAQDEGFARGVEGMELHVRSSNVNAAFRAGAWELGVLRGSKLTLDGAQVVGPRGPAVADPAGGTQVDVEARAAISAVLSALRQHGLIQS